MASMDLLCQEPWDRYLIRIQLYNPPANYLNSVLNKGRRYLQRKPSPSSREFARHAYWQAIHRDLYSLYGGICSYCASWTPLPPSSRNHNTSVDHFIPKSVDPSRAYEWDNFRLCRAELNQRKASCLAVMDPAAIENGWFTIDFTSFLLKPSPTAPDWIKHRVKLTISVFSLNENKYVHERLTVIKEYALGHAQFADVQSKYPFIAEEINRQTFDQSMKAMMCNYFQGTS